MKFLVQLSTDISAKRRRRLGFPLLARGRWPWYFFKVFWEKCFGKFTQNFFNETFFSNFFSCY